MNSEILSLTIAQAYKTYPFLDDFFLSCAIQPPVKTDMRTFEQWLEDLEYTDTFLDRKIHTLSGGQRQRIGLARCLITQPSVLIADEPTSMLDSLSKANLNRLLKTRQNTSGFSMLVVTHDLPSALKISDRIYLLRDGVLKELERALPPEKIAELMYNVAAH